MSIISIFISGIIILLLFVFALRKYFKHKTKSNLLYSLGFFETSISVFAFLISIYTKNHFAFYLYYFLGAGLTPALLGLGSVYLLKEKFHIQDALLIITIIASVALIILFYFSTFSNFNFSLLTNLIFKNIITAKDIRISLLGVGIINNGYWLIPLVFLNTIGTIEILYVALFSIIKSIKNKNFNKRTLGVIFIFIATFLLASVASISRFYNISVIWLSFLLVWIIFFAGFSLV
jgi:hypothetical protein